MSDRAVVTLTSFGEPETDDALDAFLGQCLYNAGVWSSPRAGDGIARLRVMERTPNGVRLLGAIWVIESQLREPFWLDIAENAGARFSWTLHFGLVSFAGGRPRDRRDAVDLMEGPDEGTWRVILDGTALNGGEEVRGLEITGSRQLFRGAI